RRAEIAPPGFRGARRRDPQFRAHETLRARIPARGGLHRRHADDHHRQGDPPPAARAGVSRCSAAESAAAGVEKRALLLGSRAAERAIAVGEAPEPAEDVGMDLGVRAAFGIAGLSAQRDAALLVGEILRVQQRQIKDTALRHWESLVDAPREHLLGARNALGRAHHTRTAPATMRSWRDFSSRTKACASGSWKKIASVVADGSKPSRTRSIFLCLNVPVTSSSSRMRRNTGRA